MKISITGATGLIGRKLVQDLRLAGNSITSLSRREQSTSDLKTLRWDPLAGPPPPDAIDGADAIIHLAGEPVAGGRWTEDLKRRIRESRVLGTRNLVAGIASARDRPRVLISASAVGFYGDRGDETLDEDAAPSNGFLSEVSLEWERQAQMAEPLGVRVVRVRIGVVLSPLGGALPRMLPVFKVGLGGSLGDGRQWFPWIHIDDVTGIIQHSLTTEVVNGAINAVAPGIVTNREFTRVLARGVHRTAFLPVPSFVLNLVLGEMGTVVLASQRVIPKIALATGYRFRYPELAAALAQLLSAERKSASDP